MSPVNCSTGWPAPPAGPPIQGTPLSPFEVFHRILGGHGIVAADAHLHLPVVALGQRDEIRVRILALGDLGLHLLAGLGGELHGLLGLEQRVLEQVVEPGIGALQDQRRQCRDGRRRGRRHRIHHVVDPGLDVVQGVGHREHRIELAAAVAEPELGRAAEGHRHHRGIRRRGDRLRPTDLVVPETVLRRALRRRGPQPTLRVANRTTSAARCRLWLAGLLMAGTQSS